jgi:predicted DNA-binding transcriptional regulator YafY
VETLSAPGVPVFTVRVELRFRALLGAQPLLAIGPDAEVLTPEELRRTLARQAAATAALYAEASFRLC